MVGAGVAVLAVAIGSGYVLHGPVATPMRPSVATSRPVVLPMMSDEDQAEEGGGLSKDFTSDEMQRLVCGARLGHVLVPR